jgi:hypothetical protein
LTYSQLLRPVGQVLEALGVETFKLRVEGETFRVRGERASKKKPRSTLKIAWQLLRGQRPKGPQIFTPSSGTIEIHYSREDIVRLESEGKARRQAGDRAPDAHSVSQILRATGFYVDSKEGRLLTVTKTDYTVVIEYESRLSDVLTEEFTIPSLYNFWVALYLKRENRLAAGR